MFLVRHLFYVPRETLEGLGRKCAGFWRKPYRVLKETFKGFGDNHWGFCLAMQRYDMKRPQVTDMVTYGHLRSFMVSWLKKGSTAAYSISFAFSTSTSFSFSMTTAAAAASLSSSLLLSSSFSLAGRGVFYRQKNDK